MDIACKIEIFKLTRSRCWLVCAIAGLGFCLSASGLTNDKQLSQYAHSAWRIQDGFFGAEPVTISQTVDGYIWVGTRSGLLRFDGVRFMPWVPPSGKSLPSSEITALLGGSDGSLWIGTKSGIVRWKNEVITNYPGTEGYIDTILEDPQNRIWMVRTRPKQATGPLCQITDTKSRCYGKSDGIPSPYGGTLTRDAHGNLWIGNSSSLQRWQPGSTDIYIPPALNSEGLSGVTALAPTTDGGLWVGIGSPGPGLGLQRLYNGVWKPFVTAGFDGSAIEVYALLSTRSGALIVGTDKQGIYGIHDGKVDHFTASDGLTGNSVNTAYEDREGNLWIATTKGIDCFSDRTITSFSTQQGLTADLVDSVFASSDGTIWIGNRHGLDFLRRGKVYSIREKDGLPGSQVTAIFEERPGSLWVGVDSGLWIYENGKFSPVKTADGRTTGAVIRIAPDADGSIWATSVGPPRKLIHIRNRIVVEEIVVTGHTDVLTQSPHGGVWIGQNDSLGLLRNGKIEVILSGPVSDLKLGTGMSIDSHGWPLVTTAAGLVGWRDGRPQTLTERNGLPCRVMYDLIRDLNDSLWVSAQCGLIQISASDLKKWWERPDASIQVRLFDALDGAQMSDPPFKPAVSRSPDGRLWFANQSLLQVVDPANLSQNPLLPPVHVEEVIADRKSYPPSSGLRLPALTRDLEIDYTALSFVAPKKVRFRYKLEGHDTNWQEPGLRRQAFYTDLPPGNYRFRVIACNNDGLWNEIGDALNFSIAPVFYQTTWFRLVLFVLAAGVLWLFYSFRLKRATEQIQQRLSGRLEERERIARELHDTLLQGFQGLMLRLQAVMKTLPAEEPTHQMIESVLDRADQVLLEGRQSVRDLREEGASGNELSGALARCGEELAENKASLFSLSVVGAPRALGPIVFDEAYRIGREALINAFQHSQAEKIELELTYANVRFSLRIRDDGAGIDPDILGAGRPGHWGLSGMRERAQKIGAQLNIWSRPGAGTEVELTIPAKVAYPQEGKESLWQRIRRRLKAGGGLGA
jgi:signal transduction histidine kinase/ligand-binding sensor domain-containing protein